MRRSVKRHSDSRHDLADGGGVGVESGWSARRGVNLRSAGKAEDGGGIIGIDARTREDNNAARSLLMQPADERCTRFC